MQPWAKRLSDLLEAGKDRGLDMPGLAKAVGIRQPSIWQWFNEPEGKKPTEMISAINAVRAAIYVGTTAEYLMTGKGQRESQTPRLDSARLAKIIDEVSQAVNASKKVPTSRRPTVIARWSASLYEQGIAESAVKSILATLLNSLEVA